MDRGTRIPADKMTDFSHIAEHYDLMTGFKNRLVNDFGAIKHLVDTFGLTKVLDAGCGTGVHTIILSKMGVAATGLDASEAMLERARINALNEGVKPEFELEKFEAMPNKWSDSFDAIFCLANSLVGVETGERLALALKSFKRVLKPGGRAIIQIINFPRFRRENQRIIKISSAENLTFVRFLDFDKLVTRLNVLTIKHNMGQVTHTFDSQKILPVDIDVMTIAAKMQRFSEIGFFGDLSLADSYRPNSPNLVVVLTK